MGGGDLNSKKSWHPNTMKNQERVWKAEQAAAEEKKRIMELQHERAAERDRTQLNNLVKRNAGGSDTGDDRLHWMYDKPDKKAKDEDYLLGKAIEKNYDQPEKSDDIIPAVARRVVGSSMLTTAEDTQVDLARKVREDPLLLVKERERAARAALLNNPLHRKRIAELLRKEQEHKKVDDIMKKSKKKDHDLDDKLAAKLNALGSEKGLNLAALLASDDSTTSSESEEEVKKKKKKKKKKSKKKKSDKNSHSSDADKRVKHNTKIEKSEHKRTNKSHRRRSDDSDDQREVKRKYQNRRADRSDDDTKSSQKTSRKRRSAESDERETEGKRSKHIERDRSRDRPESQDRAGGSRRNADFGAANRHRQPQPQDTRRRGGLSGEERAARLAEMAAAGSERERQRGERVGAQRAAAAAHDERAPRRAGPAPALPASLEARLHSARHYIQRDARHMDEHFARR